MIIQVDQCLKLTCKVLIHPGKMDTFPEWKGDYNANVLYSNWGAYIQSQQDIARLWKGKFSEGNSRSVSPHAQQQEAAVHLVQSQH